MPSFKFNKLVRDKLPEIYAKDKQTAEYKILTAEELRQAMVNKLIEEVMELRGSYVKSKKETTEELADIQQLVDDIRSEAGITLDELNEKKRGKKDRAGGFREGVFVKNIHFEDDDKKWTKYYRSRPMEYPEIFISSPTKKFLAGMIGGFVLVAGVVMIPYPGPGWVVFFIGLTILAREFQWAKDLHAKLHGFYLEWRLWIARQKPWTQALFWLLTFAITTLTIWLVNVFGLLYSWLGIGFEWMVSPFLGRL